MNRNTLLFDPNCILLAGDEGEASRLDQVRDQALALERLLAARGRSVEVRPGFLRSRPSVFDSMKSSASANKDRILVIPLVPFPPKEWMASLEHTLHRDLADLNLDREDPVHVLLASVIQHRPGFIQASVSRVREALTRFGTEANPAGVELVLVAPKEAEGDEVFREAARLTAQRSGFPSHRTCGADKIPALMDRIIRGERRKILVAPLGYTSEDPALRASLDPLLSPGAPSDVQVVLAGTCSSHPSFIASLSSIAEESMP